METLRQIQKKYCTRAMTAAIFAGFLLILIDQKPIGKGLILGTVFSIANFILIGQTLPLRLGQSKGKTFLFSLGSIFFRYFIIAVPLIMAIKLEQYNLFSTIFGIFLIQFFILADHVFSHFSSTREKQV
ncbi:MAG: ATP synthase subunit I [Pseudomonadota bacterium]|uniref:ATP synthase subunit I n=1 Tax=Candidatus Desulfatibia profunda TaxID=2841695 RepID=A0A8J6NNV7_9BACT|nr:ATP synthase subunit I [Candidatus Desulfatibia profunda]MBL7180591.1 ATP synthase subunit I [Desulfobacterales bacterium]MBU0699560.1 ATP synthase subunit I [Pseudomonadota bacterium]